MAIKTLSELKKLVPLFKKEGKKVVFTNGCFDLIHAGHIKLLERARKLGDVLIVGLNSDGSVRRLKGKGRPIVPQSDRARILDSIKYVDYVVIFKEDTPLKLIKELRPDVLVKGGDYKLKEIVGHDIVPKVVRVKLLSNRSTTSLINKIKRNL